MTNWAALRNCNFLQIDRRKIVGENLKILREQVSLSQKELCNIFDLSQQTYNGYEKGRYEPSIELLCEFALFYHVSVDFIVGVMIDPCNPQSKYEILAETMSDSLEALKELELTIEVTRHDIEC